MARPSSTKQMEPTRVPCESIPAVCEAQVFQSGRRYHTIGKYIFISFAVCFGCLYFVQRFGSVPIGFKQSSADAPV